MRQTKLWVLQIQDVRNILERNNKTGHDHISPWGNESTIGFRGWPMRRNIAEHHEIHGMNNTHSLNVRSYLYSFINLSIEENYKCSSM